MRIWLKKYLSVRHGFNPDLMDRALFINQRGQRISSRGIQWIVSRWLHAVSENEKLSPHTLRHTFATHLYNHTGDILVVQRALGHRDISTTLIYTHLIDRQLEEAIERL